MIRLVLLAALVAVGLSDAAAAADGGAGHGADPGLGHGGGHAPHLDGADLSLIWTVPFVGILMSIAFAPLIAPRFWHHHYGKVSAFWAVMFLGPFTVVFGWRLALFETLFVLLLEYLPFIILLSTLFTVAGGVRLKGRLVGTPAVNALILLIGTVIASWMGTTGAAMLLIRPLLRANAHRQFRVHSVVFFIFLVANIGGALSPLGDPPLFLGFLLGVGFFWPTTHLLLPMLLLAGILLVLYLILDTVLYAREGRPTPQPSKDADATGPLAVEGSFNILLLGGVIAAVLMSGVWKPGWELTVFHVPVAAQNIARDGLLIGIAFMSLWLTSQASRDANGFSWFPILEVGKLFLGIFLTIVPAIAILKAGTDGQLGALVALVSSDGQPNDAMYFWLTGVLSSVLDNAPTYLVFFNTAGGDVDLLTGPLASTLTAISAGAVFMGANTYIGNAPNFMVRAIAEEGGVRMPSFFGYMAWSGVILMPLFGLMTLVFFL